MPVFVLDALFITIAVAAFAGTAAYLTACNRL